MAEIREYGSNSNKSREAGREHLELEDRVIEKSDIGKVNVKPKSKLSKFKNAVIKEDAHNVGSWMLSEVLIPKLIDTFVDMLKGGVEMMFYGPDSRDRDRSRRSSGSKVSYRSYYDDDGRRWKDRVRDRRDDDYYDYDEIYFSSRRDAERVLDDMYDILENPKYGKIVRVADYFDLADAPGKYTDNKYGWADLRGSYIRRVGKEYVIELPKPMPID